MSGAGDPTMAEGVFSLFAMAHTLTFDGPAGQEETVPWDGSPDTPGPFTYASKPCSGLAPVNNVSSDLPALGGMVPGSRAPVSTRTHPLRVEVSGTDRGAELRGTITLTVCQLGPGSTAESDPVTDRDRPRIEVGWSATVYRRSRELVPWRGSFTLLGGTGPYEQLRGEGDIAGYFFCFDPEGCAVPGALCDCQYAMIGRYGIPEPAGSHGGG